MAGPLECIDGGLRIRPEQMVEEEMYHCIIGPKVMVAFKDAQEMLNCFEIEDPAIVERIRGCGGDHKKAQEVLAECADAQGLKK